MKRITILLSLAGWLCCCAVEANEILPLKKGLTLAQVEIQGEINTLVVLEDNDKHVKAVNISQLTGYTADIPATYQTFGARKISELVTENQTSGVSEYRYEDLISPAGHGAHHIGLGFNYRKHADEVDAHHQPFIFIKAAAASRNQDITVTDTVLLDYEIEICARPLQPIPSPEVLQSAPFGFFLCGDFTDRARLLRHIDMDDMQSGAGFSHAKSRTGYFPTGPYMVVPEHPEELLPEIVFSLYRNAQLKQQATPAAMVWKLDTVVQQVFEAEQMQRPTFSNKTGAWLVDGTISTDMVFLTGTPEGVIMRPPSLLFKIKSGIMYLFSGSFATTELKRYVVNRYIDSLIEDRTFLQNGETLTLTGRFIGQLDLSITR